MFPANHSAGFEGSQRSTGCAVLNSYVTHLAASSAPSMTGGLLRLTDDSNGKSGQPFSPQLMNVQDLFASVMMFSGGSLSSSVGQRALHLAQVRVITCY
jgi:hypothetical protein